MAQTGRKGGVIWKQVFRHQTHGAWVVLIVAVVVTAAAHFFARPKHERPVKLTDATIGLPLEPETVPMAWAVVFPAVALIITLVFTEFGIMRNKQSPTQSMQAIFHAFWMALVGFAVVLAVTEATKPVASRYRPDFLQRCLGTYDPKVPATGIDVILPEECKKFANPELLADGQKSFPSGHSSNSLSICWYCVIYLVHALYFRQGFYHMGGLGPKASSISGKPYQKVVMELLQGLLLLWLCVVLCIAWWIGVSRFVDHRHNIDDILGGFVAALLWMTPIAVISMAQLTKYHKRMTGEDDATGEAELQLPIATVPSKSVAAATTAAATGNLNGSTAAAAATGGDNH